MGATGGGVWKTTDGGTTLAAGNRRADSAARRSAPSPLRRRIPTSSTSAPGKPDIRGNIIQGDGAYKSTDGGKTWTHIGLGETQVIAQDPRPSRPTRTSSTSPRSGHHAAPNPERGVFRSKDGGKTLGQDPLPRRQDRRDRRWCSIPSNPQILYAALVAGVPQRVGDVERRTGQRPRSSRPTAAITGPRSRATRTAESRCSARSGITVSGADSNRLYAQIEAEDGGFFLSDDAGATWTKVNERRDLRQRAFY